MTSRYDSNRMNFIGTSNHFVRTAATVDDLMGVVPVIGVINEIKRVNIGTSQKDKP